MFPFLIKLCSFVQNKTRYLCLIQIIVSFVQLIIKKEKQFENIRYLYLQEFEFVLIVLDRRLHLKLY